MTESAIQPDVRELIEAKDFAALKSALRSMEIHDLTELIASLDGEDLAVAFRLLPQETATEVFGDLPHERQEELFSNLSSESFAAILNDMPPDERTEFLEELPGELAQRLLRSLRGDELEIARRLLAINVIYVVSDRGVLLDELRLEELVLADPDALVEDLMDGQFAALRAHEDREAAVEIFKKYEAVALPVVNNQGILVGIVTIDDVFEVAEEETTEDFQKVTGMGPLEGSYFATGFGGMIRKRLPWLGLLLAAQTCTTIALLGFESLPLFAVLVLFMPLINSPAGNTGSQMSGLMIRGLVVQEIMLGDWLRVLLRELLRGLALGVILAVLGFIAARTLGVYSHRVPTGQVTQIAMAVAIAITTAVTLANVLGAMLPFFFKRIGLDPAVTSGPFIASLMDVSGIVIYFSIATGILTGLV